MIASKLLKIYINICLNNTGLTTWKQRAPKLLRIYLFKFISIAGLLKSKRGFGAPLLWLVSEWFASLRHSYPSIGLFNCFKSIYILHKLRFFDYNFCNYILYHLAISILITFEFCDLAISILITFAQDHFEEIACRFLWSTLFLLSFRGLM
jgi:hypothetical protein